MFKYAIMQYTPQRYMRKADFETQDTMRHLLDFKAGRRYATKWAAQIVGKTLSAMDLTNTVIVCIPASCEQTNKRRYKRFSSDVCAMCNAINGFEHIQVIGKREKVHISKKHGQKSNVQIDTDYFNGKRVLLIDDICTTCATANAFIEQMQAAGVDKHISFHCSRHTFGTMMLTLGADLFTTSKLMGHTNIQTTEIYAKIVDKKKEEAINLIDGMFK